MDALTAMVVAIVVFALITVFNVLQDLITSKKLRAMQQETSEKLDAIHALVNSQLTEAVERLREAMRVVVTMRALLKRIAPNDAEVTAILDGLARTEQHADAPTEIPPPPKPSPPGSWTPNPT